MPNRRQGEPPYYPTKIQFVCSAQTPHLIYRACLATGVVSNTAYIQAAVDAALAADLDLDLADLAAVHPPHRGPSRHLYPHGPVLVGPANTNEEVR